MNHSRLRLGELLVDARIITNEQLETVLELQKIDRRRLGALLVEKGFLSETQLTQILSQQLAVPWVSLHHVDFSQRLLELIPADLATKYCLIPIYVRHVRAQGDTLYVAMDDPTNLEAISECSERSGLPTRAMIASPSDIRKAVALYYNLTPNEIASTTTEHDPHTDGTGAAQRELNDTENSTEYSDSTADVSPIPSSDIASAPTSDPAHTDSTASTQKTPETDSTEADSTETPSPESSPSVADTSSKHDEPTDTADSDSDDSAPDDSTPTSGDTASSADASVADASADTGVQIEIGEEMTLQELRNRRRPQQGPDSTPPSSSPTSSERLMAMTLLDGTTIAVPVRSRPEALQRRALLNALVQPSGFTKSDMPTTRQPSDIDTVRELLASMQSDAPQPDAPTSNATPAPAQPQAVLAATLKILLAKGIITPHELLRTLGLK